MKKVFVIVGIVAAAGILLLLVVVFVAVTVIHGAEGQTIYSGIGTWTRMDEFAHAEGNTNYIASADDQLNLLREAEKEWLDGADSKDISRLQKVQADAYSMMDQKIKNGLNPFDEKNTTTAIPSKSPNSTN